MGSLSFDFYKYVGCGNDFIIIDVRCNELVKFDSVSLPHFSQSICDRNYGVGADGLLVALKSTKADVKMEIYNRDGSVASMCGNGIRCFARWFRTFVTSSSNCLKIETSAGIFTAQFEDNLVKVEMPSLVKARYNIPLQLENSSANVHFLLVGVPHAVVFVDNLTDLELKKMAQEIRSHHFFGESGANVNFVQQIDKHKIAIKTYERGVEDFTLACGTGSTAAALAYAYIKKINGSIEVVTGCQEQLTIFFKVENESFSHIFMQGPAQLIAHGKYFFQGVKHR